MSYQFNDNIVTHVPTCCLIDQFTEVPEGLKIKPSGSSPIAMSIETGILLDGNGEDLLCAAGRPVSFAMAGGVCQCPDDCGVRMDFDCDPMGCRVRLACGVRTDDGEKMIEALEAEGN